MSVVLPLPYIRPFRSKCFAGGLLHTHGSCFSTGGLLELESPPASAASPIGASLAPYAILCLKHPKGKNPHPASAGTLADNRPTLLDAKRDQMVSLEGAFLARN